MCLKVKNIHFSYAIHWMTELGVKNVIFELDFKLVVDSFNKPKQCL